MMFGAKPTGFGTAFGANTAATSGFGTPTAFGTATPSAGGLFGTTATSTTGGGLFGGGGTAGTGFGTTGFNYGAGTPSVSTGGSLFGQKTQASTTGLFGTPSSSTAFGGGTGFGGAGFGTTTTSTGGGMFGTTTPTAGGLFGTASTTGFGAQQSGTTVKFNPPAGQDTMVKNGVTQNINTKHQCITAMKEYEGKSLEELRVEDYVANRKGKQAGATTYGFGTTPAAATQPSTGFTFGQTKPAGFGASTGFGGTSTSTGTSLFGQPAAPQTGTSLFGTKPFGTTTTTQQSVGFGFGGTSTGSVFGQPQQTTSLFPATSTQSSLFSKGTSTFGTTPSSGFGGFGTTSQPGGLFGAAKPTTFGTSTTASTTGFNFGGQPGTGSNLFAKPFSTPVGFGSGFSTATPSTGFGGGTLFGPKTAGTFGLSTASTAQPFNFGAGLSTGGTSLFNTSTQAKPFGNLGTTTGTTGFGGTFGAGTAMNFGGNTSTLGTNTAPSVNTSAAQVQQTLLALTHSPYGDSPLFWNMKQSSTKTDALLKPTNPAAQKAVLANQHKVSPRPAAKIKPKSLHGVLNGSKGQIFDGLEDEDFSFGNDTFMPRKSVKKLTLKKTLGMDSGTPSRASSLSGEPPNLTSLRDEEAQLRGRGSPEIVSEPGRYGQSQEGTAETDFIHSKGIPEKMSDTPNRGTSMDDTIAMLNAKNRGQTIQPPQQQPDEITNISIVSQDESNTEIDTMDERPMTPPPPHPAGLVLTRPGYYTVPSLEVLAELVDDSGDCNVEDLTIGREGYGSIFFPGITNMANLNIDEIVFFRRKEVVVYPDDENKPPLGEGLNKKAEVTLDCVWPRDKSVGTPVKSPEKLAAINWQNKIEENTTKIGAKFIDYRPETGSWVFEVKHFSKYGLVEDSDDEDLSEQEKKRLKSSQQQQIAVQVSN